MNNQNTKILITSANFGMIIKISTRCNNEQFMFYFTAISLSMFRVSYTHHQDYKKTVVTATGMVKYPDGSGDVEGKAVKK
jgi:hypothetical protein